MRRTTRTLVLAGALVLALGVAAPAQAGQADPVPITGTLSGTETIHPAGSWDFPTYFETTKVHFDIDGDGEADYSCSEPAQALVVGTLTGNVSHLGKVTREFSYCQVWEGLGYTQIDFTQVLIAANGDTLKLEGASSFWVEAGDLWWDFGAETPIAGGTGRFVDATGTLTESGRVIPSWWPPGFPFTSSGADPWEKELSLTYSGEISYDASNRAAQ